MTKRCKQRINYATFGGYDDENDDDFHEYTPPSKEKKKDNVRTLQKLSSVKIKPPLERVCVNERLFQKDLEAALELSKITQSGDEEIFLEQVLPEGRKVKIAAVPELDPVAPADDESFAMLDTQPYPGTKEESDIGAPDNENVSDEEEDFPTDPPFSGFPDEFISDDSDCSSPRGKCSDKYVKRNTSKKISRKAPLLVSSIQKGSKQVKLSDSDCQSVVKDAEIASKGALVLPGLKSLPKKSSKGNTSARSIPVKDDLSKVNLVSEVKMPGLVKEKPFCSPVFKSDSASGKSSTNGSKVIKTKLRLGLSRNVSVKSLHPAVSDKI